MRKNNRILKITAVKYPNISFLSNSGDFRKINIRQTLKSLGFQKGDFGYEIIENKELFAEVELIDNALAWKSLNQTRRLPNKEEFNFFFHLDPIVTIENSTKDEENIKRINYGRAIKELRKHILCISQDELATKIGTDKQYISKVENYKTDLELKTLRKIYEVGLNKEMVIAHYDKDDPITTFSNSVFNYKFLDWATSNKDNLELIEGIGESTKVFLFANDIKTTSELGLIDFARIIELSQKRKRIIAQKPDTWITQAKLINNSHWLSVIKLQRSISINGKSKYSKIEVLAKRNIKNDIYNIKDYAK